MPDLPQSIFLLSKCALSNIYSEHSFAHATILLSLKKFFRSVRTTKSNRSWYPPKEAAGTYRSTVGIVALGTIGRRVAQILRDQHQLNTIAYDPFVSASDAHQLGVRLVSLKELFATSDVVSLHAPDLPTTREC